MTIHKRLLKAVLITISLAAVAIVTLPRNRVAIADDTPNPQAKSNQHAPVTVAEARGRAEVLHEAIHGALQVMHRDFFREDEGLPIPSHSLEDVFSELARRHQVEVRWIAVNAEAMNIDHKPQTEFEKNAVKALAGGKESFETHNDGIYRRAGSIRLASQCLKCHLPRRTSTDDRAAGLVILIPIAK